MRYIYIYQGHPKATLAWCQVQIQQFQHENAVWTCRIPHLLIIYHNLSAESASQQYKTTVCFFFLLLASDPVLPFLYLQGNKKKFGYLWSTLPDSIKLHVDTASGIDEMLSWLLQQNPGREIQQCYKCGSCKQLSPVRRLWYLLFESEMR